MPQPHYRLFTTLLSSLIGTVLAAPVSAHPSVYATGVTLYDPTQAYNGFVLFAAADGQTYLIDMDGHAVHQWHDPGFPSLALSAAQAGGALGHVLVQLDKVSKPDPLASPGNGLSNRSIGEVDWRGRVVWRWNGPPGSQGAHQNHDIRRLPNGDTLVLSSRAHSIAGFRAPRAVDNVIDEVRPDGSIAWQWTASAHLGELGFTPAEQARVKGDRDPGFLHINTVVPLGPNRWYDAGDKRFAPDNLLINSRNANLAIIVDKHTGHVVWRLGPDYPPLTPANASKLPRPVDQMVGEHDVHMIPKGLPGAGDLLLFDNQGHAGFPPPEQGVFSASRVLQINPQTRQIVWQYTAEMSGQASWMFYSAFISSARRLPNGNTLIDEGQDGRLFQVTPTGKIVWEYVSPYFSKHSTNAVYRAQPLPYDWAPAGTPHTQKAVHSVMPWQRHAT